MEHDVVVVVDDSSGFGFGGPFGGVGGVSVGLGSLSPSSLLLISFSSAHVFSNLNHLGDLILSSS